MNKSDEIRRKIDEILSDAESNPRKAHAELTALGTDALPHLMDLCSSSKLLIKDTVLTALIDIRSPEAYRFLTMYVRNGDINLRFIAVRGIAGYLTQESEEELVLLTRNRLASVRCSALYELVAMNSESARDIVIYSLLDPAPEVRARALYSIIKVAPDIALEKALDFLTDPHGGNVFEAAVAVISEIPSRISIKILEKLIGYPNRDVVASAIWGLGNFGDTESARLIEQAAMDSIIDSRDAEYALAKIRSRISQ